MRQVLLDTHTLVWLIAGVGIGPKALLRLQQADSIFVSTISILELRMKKATGKLLEAEEIIANIPLMGVEILNFTEPHTRDYKIFNSNNKDPHDNALVSTAISTSLIFATADRDILAIEHNKLRLIDVRE